jgi:DNA replication protein DnaC
LVILDELGYISFGKQGNELLFYLLSMRNETKSTIIATNLAFNRWQEIFNDPTLTAAMVDRLTHKAHVINIKGESYRLKETKDWLNSWGGQFQVDICNIFNLNTINFKMC